MGIESGAMNPAEAEAMKAHEAKMERQRTVDAKVAGIQSNPGETRSWDKIKAQATQETDAGESIVEQQIQPISVESDFVEVSSGDLGQDGRLTREALERAKSDALTMKPGKLVRALIDSSDCYGLNWDIHDIAQSALQDDCNKEVLHAIPEIKEYIQIVQRMIELPIEYGEDDIEEEMKELRNKRQDLEDELTNLIRESDGAILSARLNQNRKLKEFKAEQAKERAKEAEKGKVENEIHSVLGGYRGARFDDRGMIEKLKDSLDKDPSNFAVGTREYRKDLDNRFFQIWDAWPEFENKKIPY